jgi:DNA repair protein RadC
LADEELLAILLRTGYRRKDVLSLARDLCRDHPGSSLYRKSFQELAGLKGIGSSRAATLLAAWELTGRHRESPETRPVIRDAAQVLTQFPDLRRQKKEHFGVLYLNTRHQLVHKETVSIGTLNASLVHPREVFEPALRLGAVSVVLVHNHPSGDPSPSAEDRALTRRLEEAGKILGIGVLDHIVVGHEEHVSFAEMGWMGVV